MAENKTQKTAIPVDDVIARIADDARRADCAALLTIMERATGVAPEVWGSEIIGFGTFHYRSPSGREGDWFPVGFASRKAAITVYLGLDLAHVDALLAALGKHTVGKGCVYIKRLSDVDLDVLEQIVARSYAHIRQVYG